MFQYSSAFRICLGILLFAPLQGCDLIEWLLDQTDQDDPGDDDPYSLPPASQVTVSLADTGTLTAVQGQDDVLTLAVEINVLADAYGYGVALTEAPLQMNTSLYDPWEAQMHCSLEHRTIRTMPEGWNGSVYPFEDRIEFAPGVHEVLFYCDHTNPAHLDTVEAWAVIQDGSWTFESLADGAVLTADFGGGDINDGGDYTVIIEPYGELIPILTEDNSVPVMIPQLGGMAGSWSIESTLEPIALEELIFENSGTSNIAMAFAHILSTDGNWNQNAWVTGTTLPFGGTNATTPNTFDVEVEVDTELVSVSGETVTLTLTYIEATGIWTGHRYVAPVGPLALTAATRTLN